MLAVSAAMGRDLYICIFMDDTTPRWLCMHVPVRGYLLRVIIIILIIYVRVSYHLSLQTTIGIN